MQTEVIQEIESTTQIVRRLLETDDLARNSVKGCIYLVWKEICHEKGVDFKIPFGLFAALPSNETITRTKRHIQNTEGVCKADPEKEERNKQRERDFRAYYGSN